MDTRELTARALAGASRLLLLRLRSLGDSILTLPLVETLARFRPDLELDVAVETPFAPVFEQHPAVRRVLRLRVRSGDEGASRFEALREIRRARYPAVVNLHGGTTSLLLTLASGAPLCIGQESFRHAGLYDVRVPPSSAIWNRTDLHTIEHQLTLLRWLGIPIHGDLRPHLAVSADARARVRDRVARYGLAVESYVVVHPTATLFTKQWPPERFAAVADGIAGEFGAAVIFTAAPAESATLEAVRARASRRHLYWADLDLAELFALLEGCRLFVGNDSGPMHAAAALGRPVAVVWGSSNFVAWRPWGCDYEIVRSDLPCMPCAGYRCEAFGQPRCILDIEVERVVQACRALLERSLAGARG